MRLSDLNTGEHAVILRVRGYGGFRRRIMEMGFVRGQRVGVVLNAPLRDPIKYEVMGYEVSLRRSEAALVEVLTEAEAREMLRRHHRAPHVDTLTEEDFAEVIRHHSTTIDIALVGNPNSGKTSLFNALSGSHEHVGNYSGVTVDAKCGRFVYRGYRFRITDLPGTYALSAYSPEELYVRRHLVEESPDVVVNAVVASNLERNLFLTTELIDASPKTVVALNMYDELEASGARLDYEHLGRMLGVPMVPVVARERQGLRRLLDTIIDVHENRDERVRHIHINYGASLEEGIEAVAAGMRAHRESLPAHFPPRYWALKLLECDGEVRRELTAAPCFAEWEATAAVESERIRRELGEDVPTAATNEKYGFISGALRETYSPGKQERVQTTALVDAVVTHKLFGLPLFFGVMWAIFALTFSLGRYPQEWIGTGVEALSGLVSRWMSPGPLHDLLVDGVVGGVGSVIVFLPNILILYLCISFMEDSGYMARAAFIMDRIMHRIGLHGKSFIPLIMGFGCNVPAIMAARTIESRSSRTITVLINPFMSCSARLPVYILLSGTFFPGHAGTVLVALYLTGIAVAVVTARLLRRFLFRKDETPFVMELPPYRIPAFSATLRHMWDKGAQYLHKMGGVILLASVAIWLLSYYPRPEAERAAAGASSLVAEWPEAERAAAGAFADASATAESLAGAQAAVNPSPFNPTLGAASEPPARGTAALPTTAQRLPARTSGPTVTDSKNESDGAPPYDAARIPPPAVPSPASVLPLTVSSSPTPVLLPSVLAPILPSDRYAHSYLGRIGRFCEPAIRPIGLDWKAGVALLSGTAAKEIVVSTLGVLYAPEADHASLGERLRASGAFDRRSALSFLVFVLLYFPCLATLAAIASETGGRRWALFSLTYNTLLAWVAAWVVYHVANLF